MPTLPTTAPSSLRYAPAALFLLALWAWLGALFPGGFAFDDIQAISENPYVLGEQPLLAAFTQDYWHHIGDAGHYRPMASLSLRLDHVLFGAWRPGYHLTSVLLHALVCALAGLLSLRLLLGEQRACLFGIAIFAVHPGLADAVAWISARSSSLAILPGLIAALALHAWLHNESHDGLARSRSSRMAKIALVVGGATLFGLLGKEDGFFSALFPALVVARSWREAPNSRTKDIVACALSFGIGLLIYGVLRNGALGAALPSAPHAPLASAAFGERMHVAGAALAEAARLVIAPLDQAPNYRAQNWANSSGALVFFGWSCWFASLAAGATFLLRTMRERTGQFALPFALLSAPLAALPVMQFIPAGEIFAGRFLYVPLLLSAPALGALSFALGAWVKTTARVPLYILAPPLAVCSMWACWDAADNYGSLRSYEEAVIARFPGDALAWNGLGLAREQEGDLPGALAAWQSAILADASYGRPHSNLGRLALDDGDRASALLHFEAAVEKGAGNPNAWCNLGALHLRMEELSQARAAYERATKLAPGMSTAWAGLGRAYLELQEIELARAALTEALRLNPSNQSALRSHGALIAAD